MKLSKKDIGKKGEQEGKKFLQEKGYNILKSNFRCPIGEIDFIAKDNSELVFVEVRTKTSEISGKPYETVGKVKQKKLYKLAQYYLNLMDTDNIECRFDVLSIILSPEGAVAEIEHIENAFGM